MQAELDHLNARGKDRATPEPSANEKSVRNRAYELHERRGGEPGSDWDDWLQAEREINFQGDDE